MKRAKTTATRRLADGRKLSQIVCPVCDHRHWVPADRAMHVCPRRSGTFATRGAR